MLLDLHVYSFAHRETKQVFLNKLIDNTKHYRNKCFSLLNSDSIMYFRLSSHGSRPGADAISTGHLCSFNSHDKNGTMTNIQARQLLILWRKKEERERKKQQVKDNTRPTAAFPPAPFSILLSLSSSRYKDPFVRKILFCRISKVFAEKN